MAIEFVIGNGLVMGIGFAMDVGLVFEGRPSAPFLFTKGMGSELVMGIGLLVVIGFLILDT